MMTTSGATSGNKVGIMTTIVYQNTSFVITGDSVDYHNANFGITGGTAGCLTTTSGATSDDKVGIMTTHGF